MSDRRAASVSSAVLFATLALAAARPARADGGIVIVEEAHVTQQGAAREGLVSSNGQRAAFVRWPDSDAWELYIDPGTLAAEGAAWILPLPVLPEVSAASPAFLEELDAATRPVVIDIVHYIRHEYPGGCSGGCLGGDGAGGGADSYDDQQEGDALPTVVQWGQGRVGGAGYEVLSATDPVELTSWLAKHGYVVPDELAELARPYVEAGSYFVVVRLVRAAGDPERLPTFRFRLAGVDRLEYPLRLTALSMGEALDFTLWVAEPPAAIPSWYRTCNVEVRGLGDFYQRDGQVGAEQPSLRAQYQTRFEALRRRRRALVATYAAPVTTADVEYRTGILAAGGSPSPLSAPSEQWAPELRALIEGGLLVHRLEGRFPRDAMTEDVSCGAGRFDVHYDGAIYEREVIVVLGSDDPFPDVRPADSLADVRSSIAAPADTRAPGWLTLALLAGVLALGVVVARRRSGRGGRE